MDATAPHMTATSPPPAPSPWRRNGWAITRIALGKAPCWRRSARRASRRNKAATQVQEYLAGKRTSFSLPLSPCGTPFQQQVWNAVADIPMRTARWPISPARIGHAGAHRAVGAAARACPFAIAYSPQQAGARRTASPGRGRKPARVRGSFAQARAKPLIPKRPAGTKAATSFAAASASRRPPIARKPPARRSSSAAATTRLRTC